RRQRVADALLWLINNNPLYKDVKSNHHSLNCLPEHGVPHDIISVETEDVHNETFQPSFGPQNAGDTFYNIQTKMNSFLPCPYCEQQEIQAIQQQLSSTHYNQATSWPTLTEGIELLLKYAEKRDGRCLYCFPSHPQFAYWAFNIIERKHIIKQTGIFL
ncbi:hypothetical protein pdam_00024513, partial [Pocillopora damicornis]